MKSSPTNTAKNIAQRLDKQQLKMLEIQAAFGADQAIGDTPTNYYRAPTGEASIPARENLPEPRVELPKPVPKASHPAVKEKAALPAPSAVAISNTPPPKLPIAPMAQQAQKLAEQAQTLEELKHIVADYDGCGLKNTASQLVFGDGVENPLIMVIGEGPGSEEDRQGRPFIGASGRLLQRSLGLIGLSKEVNMYITNVVYWRPPADRTPTDTEVAACLPFLVRQISLLKPKLIVLSGARASQSLLGSSYGITRLRGAWYPLMDGLIDEDIPALAMFHPAYLFRNHVQKRLFWQDILRLRAEIDARELNVPWPEASMYHFTPEWRV